jgi:hypothetical protein
MGFTADKGIGIFLGQRVYFYPTFILKLINLWDKKRPYGRIY